MRTIKQFINKTKKVYFFMKDEATCRSFFQAAEAEGISFCETPPTHKETSDIIALLPSGEICYVGWAGRMCYHNCKKGVVRIDYDRYSSGHCKYKIKKPSYCGAICFNRSHC